MTQPYAKRGEPMDIKTPNSIKRTKREYNGGFNEEQDFPMASPEPTAFSKNSSSLTATRKSSNVSRKRRQIEYLSRLKDLNESFEKYIAEQNNKTAQAMEKGSFTDGTCHLFLEEIQQYKFHVDRLKQEYLRKECTLWTFGSGDCGQLGLKDDRLEALRPAQVKNLPSNVTVLSCGGLHSAIACSGGEVYTWGCNDDGALGLNPYGKSKEVSTAFVPMKVNFLCQTLPDKNNPPPNEPIKWVATGDSHTLALSYSGKVFMFGAYKDKEGRSWRDIPPNHWPISDLEISKGSPKAPKGIQPFPVPVSLMGDRSVEMIACGCSFNAAILNDKSLVTWGVGECGELGRPSQEIRRPDGSYDLDRIQSQYLTPDPVLWAGGGSYSVHSVACGGYHTLVITEGLRVATTGLNNYGQLGHGDEKNRDRLTFVEALDDAKIKAVDGGAHHSLCLADNGRLIAFGRADSGQLGITDSIPNAGKFENAPVEVYLPGDSIENKKPIEPVSQISCGSNHNLAITETGSLYTWGYGEMGALGHGVEIDDYRPRKLKMKSDWKVYAAVGGGQHSALLCAKSS